MLINRVLMTKKRLRYVYRQKTTSSVRCIGAHAYGALSQRDQTHLSYTIKVMTAGSWSAQQPAPLTE